MAPAMVGRYAPIDPMNLANRVVELSSTTITDVRDISSSALFEHDFVYSPGSHQEPVK